MKQVRHRLAVLALVSWAAFAGRAAEPIAMINGRPLDRDRLVELLIQAHGVGALQQLIALDLAEQEGQRIGVRISEADIDQEFQDSLLRMLPADAPGAASLSQEQRVEALQRLLAERGLSMAEYRIAMRRNAYLRRVIENEVTISDATIREEFDRVHGAKVEVRHIQIAARDYQRVQQAFNRLQEGAAFEQVARDLSENEATRANGGLLPPFSFEESSVDAALREAAFALSPAEVSRSAVLAGKYYHILKLERRIPPQGVSLDQVRSQLESQIRQRAVLKKMNEKIEQLLAAAQVRILDRDLRENYEQFMSRRSAQAAPPMP